MGNKAKHGSKLTKCIKAPIRILAKARDLYVNSLSAYSGSAFGAPPTRYVSSLPKCYSTSSHKSSSTDEDLRELIRAASQRGQREKLEREFRQKRQSSNRLPRSFTVGFQRIDEDEICDFDDDVPKVKKVDPLYPRSRSHALSSKKTKNLYSS